MMTDEDWTSYRQKAGQESANLNKTPFVMDPAALTGDATANRQMLYPTAATPDPATTGANLTASINKAFTDLFGRPASITELAEWTAGAKSNGLTPDQVSERIISSWHGGTSSAGGGGGFASGMMAQPGQGNVLSGGFNGTGMMGQGR